MIRFDALPPDLLRTLRHAGWHPWRRVDVSLWTTPLRQEGYTPHPLAEEVLAALGGLTVPPLNTAGPYFTNDEPFTFDPLAAGSGQRALAREIEQTLGGSYFPLGEWLSHASVFVEKDGRVVAAGLGWIWELGPVFEDALELAICANRPMLCLHADPGLKPWPHPITGEPRSPTPRR